MMADRFAEIGERLRAYRTGRGLAADQVAERLGVSRAAIYRIEAGEIVKIETLELDPPRADEVLVRLVATGICHTDIAVHHREDSPVPSILGHEGAGIVVEGAVEHPLRAGDVVLVKPNEIHQFRNTGDRPLKFLCLIPNSATGKSCTVAPECGVLN